MFWYGVRGARAVRWSEALGSPEIWKRDVRTGMWRAREAIWAEACVRALCESGERWLVMDPLGKLGAWLWSRAGESRVWWMGLERPEDWARAMKRLRGGAFSRVMVVEGDRVWGLLAGRRQRRALEHALRACTRNGMLVVTQAVVLRC